MKVLLRNFIVSSIILWLFSLFGVLLGNYVSNTTILFLNFGTIILYFMLLQKSISIPYEKLNSKTIFWIVLFFSFIFLVAYKWIYYDHHGDFFTIDAFDAINYHKAALKNADYSFGENITNYLKQYEFADLGALMFVTTVYKAFPSALAVDFCNIIIGALSSVALFKISLYYMPRKYAFLCAVSYYCSSFIIQFESSGLKEPLFAYVFVLCFLFYVKYINHKSIKHLIYFCITATAILLFRPAVLGFLLISIGAGFFFQSKKVNGLLVILVLIAAIYTISALGDLFQTFSSFDRSISYRDDATNLGGENVAIYAAILSGLLGPLPTLLPFSGKEISSIYSIGLIFRVLISMPFWLGVIFVVKRKVYSLFPIVIMVIAEIFALVFVMESYELRYHLIHLPFVYLIAFYFLYILSTSSQAKKTKSNLIINYSAVVFVGIILYWNWRIF